MGHGPEEHIEHAEHAQHAAHNPFDKRVTVSIAIVAAVLAGVTMLGHKAHNDVLRLQGEALENQTAAGINHSKAANMWNLYQAQNIRGHMYLALAKFTDVSPAAAGKEKDRETLSQDWKNKRNDYEEKELPKWKARAEALTDKAEEHEKDARQALKKSHEAHYRADRFDLGELCLQLGVVLCSLAILTKSRGFWFGGLACALAGLVVALTGQFSVFMDHH